MCRFSKFTFHNPTRIPGDLIPIILMEPFVFFIVFLKSEILMIIYGIFFILAFFTISYDFWGIDKFTMNYTLKDYRKNPDPPFKFEAWHKSYLWNLLLGLILFFCSSIVFLVLYFVKTEEANIVQAVYFLCTSILLYVTVHAESIQIDRFAKKIFDYFFIDDVKTWLVKDEQKFPSVKRKIHFLLKYLCRGISVAVTVVFYILIIIPSIDFSALLFGMLISAIILGKLSLCIPKNNFRYVDEDAGLGIWEK